MNSAKNNADAIIFCTAKCVAGVIFSFYRRAEFEIKLAISDVNVCGMENIMKLKFSKMHGTGNDYVYVNGFTEKLDNPSETAIKLSDRHFAIGSDGLIIVAPSEVADVRMIMFNSDGSEGKMCGMVLDVLQSMLMTIILQIRKR